MRRRSTTSALSPKLLTHFAAATVVATALLAVFASGEEWGGQAQVRAVEAKNQLANTESEKLGTKRIGAAVKIANAASRSGFGEDEAIDTTGGVGGGNYAPPAPQTAIGARQSESSQSPLSSSSVPSMPPPMPGAQPAPAKAKPVQSKAPLPNEIAQLTAKSAQRSGTGSVGD